MEVVRFSVTEVGQILIFLTTIRVKIMAFCAIKFRVLLMYLISYIRKKFKSVAEDGQLDKETQESAEKSKNSLSEIILIT